MGTDVRVEAHRDGDGACRHPLRPAQARFDAGATRVAAVPMALATRSNVLREGGHRWSAVISSAQLRM